MSSFSPSTVRRKVRRNRPRLDLAALERHLALRQQAALEDLVDRLEIEIRGHVHDREIFLVEVADRVGLLEIAFDPVMKQIDEGFRVALGVHAHEGAELQESRIDPPSAALEFIRHDSDQIIAEPFDRLLVGEIVDLGGRDARVDRARHQGEAGGNQVRTFGRHDGRGAERRHRRLTNRHDVATLADEADEIDQMLSVVGEAEGAFLQLDVARVDPVGDENLVILEEGADGAAQQRREMARHRRHQQDFGVVGGAFPLEVQQLAKGRAGRPPLRDRSPLAARLDAVDAVVRPRMGEAGERHQLVIGGHPPQRRSEGFGGPGVEDRVGVRSEKADTVSRVGHRLIGVVQHCAAR